MNEPIRPRPQGDDRMVTVCDQCLCASCWGGVFMCFKSGSAGTVDKTVAELRELDREHSDWWDQVTYDRWSWKGGARG